MNTRASGGLLLTLLTMTCPAAEAATRVSKPAFPESVVIGDRTLRRQGTGVLKFKKVIALYDAALYLAQDGQPGKALQDVPKRIEVFYRVNAKAERFNRAGQKVLEKNFAGAELEALYRYAEKAPQAEGRLDIAAATVQLGEVMIDAALPADVQASFLDGGWNATSVLLEAGEAIVETASRLPYLTRFTY